MTVYFIPFYYEFINMVSCRTQAQPVIVCANIKSAHSVSKTEIVTVLKCITFYTKVVAVLFFSIES